MLQAFTKYKPRNFVANTKSKQTRKKYELFAKQIASSELQGSLKMFSEI